jgi:hypothetical protein
MDVSCGYYRKDALDEFFPYDDPLASKGASQMSEFFALSFETQPTLIVVYRRR